MKSQQCEQDRKCQHANLAKSTTIKEALAKWEEKSGEKAGDAKEVKLYGQIPPIEKMDASLSTLTNCEKLSLSTNCIEKIANLNGLKNLKILSLGRNNIKNLNGLVRGHSRHFRGTMDLLQSHRQA
ncbi:dynein axonemal light chain 1 isoform X3 [Tachysurus fulvidraco]|uniref:dynein axonemal light chain 1 isoform X3 n=1 Tax=Tachysurus fulvidraco TaxID=1234273 RepID=UPI001FEDFA68|nr:dynein axonemal light chain 1 isoform X3 [Tachysurus fulvidraco]